MPAGCVYLVPVPIGNLGDITLRALETLKKVDLIACEDTRNTGFLLSQYEIKPPRLISLHKYNERKRSSEILGSLLAGHDVAVVSDAGSPGISDPALLFIQSAIESGIQIVPLPGATALIPALIASGLNTSLWQFCGFAPLKVKDRRAFLQHIKDYPGSSVLYESPHRIRQTLEDLLAACGDRQVCIGREISKLHEEFIRGTLSAIVADYQIKEKGEFVVVVGAAQKERKPDPDEVARHIDSLLAEGQSMKSVAESVAERFSLARNEAYQIVLQRKKEL